MKTEVFDNADLAAQKAAACIASEANQAVALRGRFILAVSGGKTPWKMLRYLADEDLPWQRIHILQVDERIAPDGDNERNLTHIRESLLHNFHISPQNIHAMQVNEKDPEKAAEYYSGTIRALAGPEAIIDLIHLGLGPDGHCASLIPGDPVLEVSSRDVATTGIYQGRRRLTLTYPILNRARKILWLITGSEKSEMLQRLLAFDISIPAGRISQKNARLIADKESAGKLD
jgi:6-phosphogluconolactonase